jgi:choline dehydrogenase-like flavoprotein
LSAVRAEPTAQSIEEQYVMADEHYDAIVIGTSQGGRFLPVDLAKAGQKVALVERGPLGGVCVNTGCTPTKTMIASARLAYQARRAAEYGVRTGPVSVDLAAVRERKRAMVGELREPAGAGRPRADRGRGPLHWTEDGRDHPDGRRDSSRQRGDSCY